MKKSLSERIGRANYFSYFFIWLVVPISLIVICKLVKFDEEEINAFVSGFAFMAAFWCMAKIVYLGDLLKEVEKELLEHSNQKEAK